MLVLVGGFVSCSSMGFVFLFFEIRGSAGVQENQKYLDQGLYVGAVLVFH